MYCFLYAIMAAEMKAAAAAGRSRANRKTAVVRDAWRKERAVAAGTVHRSGRTAAAKGAERKEETVAVRTAHRKEKTVAVTDGHRREKTVAVTDGCRSVEIRADAVKRGRTADATGAVRNVQCPAMMIP